MENQEIAVDFSYNPDDVEAPGRDTKFIFKVPSQDKALICKIVPDPRNGNGKSWYRQLRQFPFMVGPNPQKDTRTKVCQSFFGDRSPENDAYWEYKKRLSTLEKTGQGNSTEAAQLKTLTKMFQPRDGGWLLIVEPDSPAIKAVRVPISVLQLLTGKEATQTKPAIPSLIKTMAADGVSPFDIKQRQPKLGWLKIYKTGEGLATRYHVEPLQHEMPVTQNGKTYTVKDYTERNVHEKILTGKVTLGDIPDVVEFEKKNAWTMEECEEYVKSLGTKIPDRFLRKQHTQDGRVDETDEASRVSVPSLDALPILPDSQSVAPEDIPF